MLCGQTKHIVQRGETPESIAHKFNIPLETLIDANPRLNDYCYVTMELTIPVVSGEKAHSESTPLSPTQNNSVITDYEQALEYGLKGDSEFERGNYSSAARLYTKGIKLNPTAWDYRFNRGASYYNNKNYSKAIEDFKWVLNSVDDQSIRQAAEENISNARINLENSKAHRKEILGNIGATLLGVAALVGAGVAIAAATQQSNDIYQPTYSYGANGSDWTDDYTAAVIRQANATGNRFLFEQQQLFNRQTMEANARIAESQEVMDIHYEWLNDIWPEDFSNGKTIEQSFQSFFHEKYGRMPTNEQMMDCLFLIPPAPDGSSDSNSYPSTSSDDSFSTSIASTGNYQADYDALALSVEKNFNSLSAMGYKYTDDKGEVIVGVETSFSPVSETATSRIGFSIREKQHEMQKIREEAARKGITITKSPWETQTYSHY